MNTFLLTTLLASTVVAANALQSPNEPAPRGRLSRAAPQQRASDQNADEWQGKLLDPDLDARERNYDALIAAARRDARLRQSIDDWSRDASNGELAWTARMLLRELRTQSAWQAWPQMQLPPGFEMDFDRFGDPQALLDQFQQGFGGRFAMPAAPQAGDSNFESFSLQMDGDGVHCKVTKKVDGQEVTEDYQAKSMDELLQAHPELRGKIDVQRFEPFDLFGAQGGPLLRFGAPRGQRTPLEVARESSEIRTDVLGVVVEPLGSDAAKDLGLDAGAGLRIERVEPGTIAAQLGLQRGHVLLEINGQKIATRDDITNAIQKRGADGELRVTVVDRWGQKRERVWKPDSAKQI